MAKRLLPLAAGLAGLAILVAGCGGAAHSSSSSGASGTAGGSNTTTSGAGRAASPGPATLGAHVAAAGPDIVETAALQVKVGAGAVAADAGRVTVLAAREGGYVQSSTVSSGKHPSAALTVRVPDRALPATLSAIGRFGSVLDQSQAGEDVTGQVVDLALEQANLEREARAVRAILGRASKVSDVLTIQNQLFTLQGEIQQLQAERNGLANRVAYATLAVTLTARVAPAAHPPGTLVRFWRLASHHTVQAARGVVLAVGWFAPGLIVLAVAAGAYLAVRRRRRHRASLGA